MAPTNLAESCLRLVDRTKELVAKSRELRRERTRQLVISNFLIEGLFEELHSFENSMRDGGAAIAVEEPEQPCFPN